MSARAHLTHATCAAIVGRCWRALVLPLIAAVLPAAPVRAQSVVFPVAPPSLDVSLPAELLSDLPHSGNLPGLLGVLVPELVPDRIETGGLSTGESARLGVHASSWTQTQFRLGDVDVTDPDGSGTPLFVPGVLEWQRVDMATGLQTADLNAPALAFRLVPRDPEPVWTRVVEGWIGPSGLTAGRSPHDPPAVQRASTFGQANAMASGPLVRDRLGLLAAGSWMRSSRYDRIDPTLVDATQSSLFAHLLFTPSAMQAVRTIVVGQQAEYPSPNRVALRQPNSSIRDRVAHLQSTWEGSGSIAAWRVYGAYSSRNRQSSVRYETPVAIERLRDGPVLELLYPAAGTTPAGTTRRWSAGTRLGMERVRWAEREHTPTVGFELSGSRAEVGEPVAAQIGELVNGIPARVWNYSGWQVPSRWRATTVAGYVSDSVAVRRNMRLDAGLRFERIAGNAVGAARGIRWQDWYPRLAWRWEPNGSPRFAVLSGYGRFGYALPLRWLAAGDPAAPVATVSRWLGASTSGPPKPGEIGSLIARVGPGSGDAGLTTIDPAIERPRADELIVGVESRRWANTTVRLTGYARWEHQGVGLTNPGVPDETYSTVSRLDNGHNEEEFTPLPAYNRSPATYGADRYVLTNPVGDNGTFVGLDLTVQRRTKRFFFLGGATAGQVRIFAANRGFLSVENDAGLLGEVFANPNARTNAPGRPFTDRAFTFKMSGTYRFPKDVRLGVIARYQDGQTFSRLVVFEGLNQGPEPVRAFENGDTRFTFTMTIDARLQKEFRFGERRIALLLDAYNLSNRLAEVEESQADGPTWRAVTAVQPPLAIHAGVRVVF